MMPFPPNEVLNELLTSRKAIDLNGKERVLCSEIATVHASALYDAVLRIRPRHVVEVGMAFGVSTLAILAALESIGADGKLVSIDPNQGRDYGGVGVANVQRARLQHRHRLIETASYLALPQLLTEGATLEFSYIDGWHTFDYTLLDFFYLDKMTGVGGIVGFNDCGWRSVARAISFVKSHRDYEEIDVGLKPSYRGRNIYSTILRTIERRSSSDRYFRKLSLAEPEWNFYHRF